jgi:cytohesin
MGKKRAHFLLVFFFAISAAAFGQDLFDAVKKNDLTQVRAFLEKEPASVTRKDADGRTVLHWAARARRANVELMTLLIDKGADVNARDNNRIVPLHSAASRSQKKAVALLVARGADLNAKDNDQRTPLGFAATDLPFGYQIPQDKKDTVKILVEAGAEFPIAGEEARALLQAAAASGYKELAEQMIARGADVNTRNDDDGTLLHSVAAGGVAGLVDVLIDKKMEVNARNRYGLTPLHIAAMVGNAEIVGLLLARGANPDDRCPCGKTAFNYATEGRFKAVTDLLAAKGADQGPPRFPVLTGPYLGQKPPGEEPEIFAPGIVSTMGMQHGPAVFSSDGREVY